MSDEILSNILSAVNDIKETVGRLDERTARVPVLEADINKLKGGQKTIAGAGAVIAFGLTFWEYLAHIVKHGK